VTDDEASIKQKNCLHFKQKGIRYAHKFYLKSDGFGSQKHAEKAA